MTPFGRAGLPDACQDRAGTGDLAVATDYDSETAELSTAPAHKTTDQLSRSCKKNVKNLLRAHSTCSSMPDRNSSSLLDRKAIYFAPRQP
jgi:hypothetical protein